LLDQEQLIVAREEPLAGQRFPQTDPECKEIGAPVDMPEGLLGRHVAHLALDAAGLRVAELADGFGDTEID
jgi:hypothetical protein